MGMGLEWRESEVRCGCCYCVALSLSSQMGWLGNSRGLGYGHRERDNKWGGD